MLNILDEILLSDNVVENFYYNYSNPDFNKWIISILPEVEYCKNQRQDNPWHIYNVLDHILHSVNEMNKQTKNLPKNERRLLAYTMFLHDIGKPQCYIRRYSKLYKRKVDSFYNHNIAGVKIANKLLNQFNFNVKEINIISKLVEEHDMFMNITLKDDANPYHKVLTPKLIEEKIKQLNKVDDGKTLMRYLLIVGRADNRAQNPELTKESLYKLEIIEKMLENFIRKI